MALPLAEFSETLSALVEKLSPSLFRVEGHGRGPVTGIAIAEHRILTSAAGVRAERVTLTQDGKTFEGTVRGRDPGTDLALIETTEKLTPLTLETALVPKVGTLVLQLARPGRTVRATSGIVMASSATEYRSFRGGTIDRYLETDAVHEAGFSGGPLVDAHGRVLGVASVRIVGERSVTVPSVTIARVVELLEKHGKVPQSWLGLEMQPVTLPADVQKSTGEDVGLLVLSVTADGPAQAAGIQYGDTVLHLGDDTVKTVRDVKVYLQGNRVGQSVPLTVFRQGQTLKVPVTVAARP